MKKLEDMCLYSSKETTGQGLYDQITQNIVMDVLKDKMDQELIKLREELNLALEKKDGWLVHYYGSQIQHRETTKLNMERDHQIRMNKLERIKEECLIKAELLYDRMVSIR